MTPRQVGMLAAISAIWGASYLLIKVALEGLEPAMIVFARLALAAAVLYLVIVMRGGEDAASLRRLTRAPMRGVWQGVLSVAAPFVLIAYGEEHISSGLTGVLVAPAPLFVALAAPLVDRSELVDRWGGIGMALGFGGVGLLVGVDTSGQTAEILGALAVLGAALCYAAGSMFAKLRLADVPPLVTSFFACAVAAAITAVPALATIGGNHPDAGEIAAVVSLGVTGTALAFVWYFALINEVGAGRASLCGYLIPPLALVYGALLLDERISVVAIVGLVMILAGVMLAGRRPTDRPPEPA